jgi:hypothetical protein
LGHRLHESWTDLLAGSSFSSVEQSAAAEGQ